MAAYGTPAAVAACSRGVSRACVCPYCDEAQSAAPDGAAPGRCRRCRSPLRHVGGNESTAFACSVAALALLAPALLEPFLTTAAFGAERTSTLPASIPLLWNEGAPWLALAFLLFVVIFPVARFSLLCLVLGTLRTASRPRWLGAAFRRANALETWSMSDVLLLGMAIAFVRLRASLQVTLDVGGMCFVAATLLGLFTRAALDRDHVWRRIGAAAWQPAAAPAFACRSCGLGVPDRLDGERCPRCRARLRRRMPHSLSRSMAWLTAAALLILPANFYPIASIPIDLVPTSYTVMGGILDLADAGFMGLAALVFCVSLTIPLAKLAGLAWCTVSAAERSNRRLVAKTRVYRWLEEIGRWSMVDPFTIACFVPVVHFNSLLDSRAEAAATPFAAVVIFTILAVKSFDPRCMWELAERAA